MRKHPVLSVIGVIAVIVIIAAAASSSKNKTSGSTEATKSPALVKHRRPATRRTPKAKPQPKPQTFEGAGGESIGTISVPVDSTLTWSCPSCTHDNFIVDNSFEDEHHITLNELNQTSGKTALSAGVYHEVEVDTEGEGWTITITPGQ